jgi:hypothetical protein
MSNSCTTQSPLRLLVAPDPESLDLVQTMLNAAVLLVPVNVETHPPGRARKWSVAHAPRLMTW